MNDISDILSALLDQHSRISEAEDEFKMMLEEDKSLLSDYKEWCDERGYDTKTGYQDYFDELMESRDSIWENINE